MNEGMDRETRLYRATEIREQIKYGDEDAAELAQMAALDAAIVSASALHEMAAAITAIADLMVSIEGSLRPR